MCGRGKENRTDALSFEGCVRTWEGKEMEFGGGEFRFRKGIR